MYQPYETDLDDDRAPWNNDDGPIIDHYEPEAEIPAELPRLDRNPPGLLINADINRLAALELRMNGMDDLEITAAFRHIFGYLYGIGLYQHYTFRWHDGREDLDHAITRKELDDALAKHRTKNQPNPSTTNHDHRNHHASHHRQPESRQAQGRQRRRPARRTEVENCR